MLREKAPKDSSHVGAPTPVDWIYKVTPNGTINLNVAAFNGVAASVVKNAIHGICPSLARICKFSLLAGVFHDTAVKVFPVHRTKRMQLFSIPLRPRDFVDLVLF